MRAGQDPDSSIPMEVKMDKLTTFGNAILDPNRILAAKKGDPGRNSNTIYVRTDVPGGSMPCLVVTIDDESYKKLEEWLIRP
jgi:hypothetical protein